MSSLRYEIKCSCACVVMHTLSRWISLDLMNWWKRAAITNGAAGTADSRWVGSPVWKHRYGFFSFQPVSQIWCCRWSRTEMWLSLIQPTKWAKHGEGQIMSPLRSTWTREKVFRTHLFASLGAWPVWLTGGACLSSIKKYPEETLWGSSPPSDALSDAEQSSVFGAGCKYLSDTGGWLHCSLHHLLTSCCLVSAPYEEGRYDHLIHNSCTHLHQIHEAKHEAACVSWDMILILSLFIANNQSHQGLLLLKFSHSSSLSFSRSFLSHILTFYGDIIIMLENILLA